MTRTLILIRHAKSDWDDPGLDDHDRRSTTVVGSARRASAPGWPNKGFAPDAVLCSTARRTRETWDGIAAQLPGAPEPVFSHGLYHAAPADMLNAIRDSDAERLAVVAHNPGIGSLAWSLCATTPQHPKFGLYPTGATLILSFDVAHMSDIAPGRGKVVGFAVPRELPDPK
jgi:phosphohistidine phosphatase